jgi:hypothetical protein
MNKYQAYVRIKGQLVNTAVFADSPIHARLILQYQFGMNSLASSPSVVTHKSKGYQMIDEVISAIKAKAPQTPEQARVASLQKQKDDASKALKLERNRQKIKRAQQQISAANSNI